VRLLLDSQAVFWSLEQQSLLSNKAFEAIESEKNEVLVSVVSAWEMAIKVGTGKWPEARHLVDSFETEINERGLTFYRLVSPTFASLA
jgi:PIN domain nuclease of toxin-antitoxin system